MWNFQYLNFLIKAVSLLYSPVFDTSYTLSVCAFPVNYSLEDKISHKKNFLLDTI